MTLIDIQHYNRATGNLSCVRCQQSDDFFFF